MSKRNQRPNDKKLRELILLICARSENDDPFGAVKLNKLLFFCDFMAYLNLGAAITWHEYFRLPQGPAPKKLLPVTERMKEDGEFAYKVREYFSCYTQKKPLALREPDVSVFTAKEVNLVDHVIQKFWGKSATEISEYSHGFVGWKLASNQEIIPYNLALVGNRKPTSEEEERGLKLQGSAKKHLASHASA